MADFKIMVTGCNGQLGRAIKQVYENDTNTVILGTDVPDLDITDLIVLEEEEETAREKKDSDGAYLLTVTCTGDFTIGGDNRYGTKKDLFSPELEKHNGDINFVMQNVRDILMDDDLTIVNFEGTLTDTKYVPADKKENEFLFNITPSAVSVLPDNSVEAVSLDNNHVWDHGLEGYMDTLSALTEANVIYSTPGEIGVFDYKGILKIAMLSFNCLDRYDDGFKKYYSGNSRHEETGTGRHRGGIPGGL